MYFGTECVVSSTVRHHGAIVLGKDMSMKESDKLNLSKNIFRVLVFYCARIHDNDCGHLKKDPTRSEDFLEVSVSNTTGQINRCCYLVQYN